MDEFSRECGCARVEDAMGEAFEGFKGEYEGGLKDVMESMG